MKKAEPMAADGNSAEDRTTQPLGSAVQAARLQSVPAASSDNQPATGTSAVRSTFTFTSAVTGEKVTVTCMPGCTVAHAADGNTTEHPHDVYCEIPGTASELPLFGPLCDTGSPEDFRFLGWKIETHPCSERLAERLPFVAIEVVDDHYIEYLDPDTLEVLINRLQKQVDSLRNAHAQLVDVRAVYLNPTEVAA